MSVLKNYSHSSCAIGMAEYILYESIRIRVDVVGCV